MKSTKLWRFGLAYGLLLAAAAVYVMLDVFVIPRTTQAIGATAETTVTEATTAEPSEQTTTADTTAPEETTAAETTLSDGEAAALGAYTDSSYTDPKISINILTARVNGTTYYAADIVLSDVSYLKTAFAQGTYGRNIKERTSVNAANNNAIIAINGDYYGFRDSGFVIRNGVLYRDTCYYNDGLAIMSDGSFRMYNESEADAWELLNAGALQAFTFGPTLLDGGEILVAEGQEVDRAMNSNPRTAIGMIAPLHYLFLVSDGRTDDSEGLTLYQLAELMKSLGCTEAYNLDGGGSATMWFNGKIVNIPTDGSKIYERAVSDIVYIGY